MVDRSVSFGPITVTFGNVATWCGRMLQPASPAGVQIKAYTFAVSYSAAWSQVNPPLMDLSTDGSGLVPVNTWLQANDSFVVMLRRTVPPPDGASSNHDALAVNIVSYELDPADEGNMVAPCAIGSPSNPAILAHRQSPLWFDGPPVTDLPSVIDLDVCAPFAGWPSWANARPTMAEVLPRWAGYCGELWGGGWGFASRLPAAHHSRGGYGHYYSGKVSDGMMMALSKEGTSADRKELARRITQWGVDIYWAFRLGRNDGVDGGHYQGRLGLIIWAGHFLQDSNMLNCVSLLPGQLNEPEQFYTTTPKAWAWSDRNWIYGYKGKSESPTNLLAPVNQWGTHFETMLYLTGYFQPTVGSQVGTALSMQILGRTPEMGVAHRGMVAQFMEGPGPANLAALDDIVITCIDPRDGQVFDDGHPRDILWGYSDSPDDYNGFGRAAWAAYSNYTPPAAQVNVPVGPGTSAYQSTRYTATINDQPAYVYGHARACGRPTAMWTFGDVIEQSWLKFTANGTCTVRITKVSGPISSADVYPGGVVTKSIVGGVLVLTIPTRTYVRVVVDGDRANAMAIWSNPLPAALGSATDWTTLSKTISTVGENTITMSAAHGWDAGQRVIISTTGTLPTVTGAALSVHEALWVVSPSGANLQLARTPGGTPINFTGSGTGTLTLTRGDWTSGTLYFPPGVHTISRMFKLSSGVRLYFHLNAAVIGAIDLRGTDGVLIEGPGHLLGLFSTPEWVNSAPLTYLQRLEYTMLLGYDGSKFAFDNEVRDITIAICPWGTEFICTNRWIDVSVMSPWYFNNGLAPIRKNNTDNSSLIEHCFIYTADDTFTIGEQATAFNITIRNCVAITVANSNVHLSYWPGQDLGYSTLIEDCDFLHFGIADRGPGTDDSAYCPWGGNSIFKSHVDGAIGEEAFGRFRVLVRNCRVWDTVLSRVFHFGNRDYTWDWPSQSQSRQRRGQIQGFVFENIWIEHVPGQTSDVFGLDADNRPRDIAWENLQIAGVLVTAANARNYFTIDRWSQNITFNGVRVDTQLSTSLAGSSSSSFGMSGRFSLASLSSASSLSSFLPGKFTVVDLASVMAGSSSLSFSLNSILSLSLAMAGSSSAATNVTGGFSGISVVMSAASFFYLNLDIVYSEANKPDTTPMKQRIYNALLALCTNGPYFEAKVDGKSGRMTVFSSKPAKPVSVGVVEIDKTFAPAARYRRAFNVAEIQSWVFQVTLQFPSGLRVSCEQFEGEVSDAGITIQESKNVPNQRTLLAQLVKARYDEPPAQNPSLGSVVTFTFEVVPATLRK